MENSSDRKQVNAHAHVFPNPCCKTRLLREVASLGGGNFFWSAIVEAPWLSEKFESCEW